MVTTQRQIFELLIRMKSEKTSLLFITHDMGVIWQLCDRVIVMEEAQIVEKVPSKSFLSVPHTVIHEVSSLPCHV